MRMRRKKHLKERLDKVSSYVLKVDTSILNSKFSLNNPDFIDLVEVFNNNNQLFLEIGCGKGGFITEMAQKHQNVNFIAVELLENIIVQAVEKAEELGLSNVKFLNIGAQYLLRYFKENTVSNIYLNFSPPYPQNSYENRRLTNSNFLSIYKHIMSSSGKIIQKTDDKDFFDYSVRSFLDNGFTIEDCTEYGIKDDVMSEYERKYLKIGKKIYKLIAKPCK